MIDNRRRSIDKIGCYTRFLYRVHKKRLCRVPLSVASLTRDSSFILVDEYRLGGKVYVWFGADCQIFTRNLAKSIGQEISHDELHEWRNAFWVIEQTGTDAGSETGIMPEERAFWEALGSKGSSRKTDIPPVANTEMPSCKLFRFDVGKGGLEDVATAEGMQFDWAHLSPDDGAVLMDCGGGEIYLWVGDEATMETRERARAAAVTYRKALEGWAQPGSLVVIQPGKEGTKHNEKIVLFHQRFSKFGAKKAKGPGKETKELVKVASEVDRMHSWDHGTLRMQGECVDQAMSSHPLPLSLLYDDSATLTAWRVSMVSGGFEEVNREDVGLLCSHDAVAVLHTAKAGARRTLFLWAGSREEQERGVLAIKAKQLDPNADQIQLEQGTETPFFLLCHAHAGKPVLVLDGKASSPSPSSPLSTTTATTSGGTIVGNGSATGVMVAGSRVASVERAGARDSGVTPGPRVISNLNPKTKGGAGGIAPVRKATLSRDNEEEEMERKTRLTSGRVFAISESAGRYLDGRRCVSVTEQDPATVEWHSLCPQRSYIIISGLPRKKVEAQEDAGAAISMVGTSQLWRGVHTNTALTSASERATVEAVARVKVVLWHGRGASSQTREVARSEAAPGSRLSRFLSNIYGIPVPPPQSPHNHPILVEEEGQGGQGSGGGRGVELIQGMRPSDAGKAEEEGWMDLAKLATQSDDVLTLGDGSANSTSGAVPDASGKDWGEVPPEQGSGSGLRIGSVPAAPARPARLFLVSNTDRQAGAMFVREIGAGEVFRQCDLCQHESYLLDGGGDKAFVLHGSAASHSTRELAVEVSCLYVETMPQLDRTRQETRKAHLELVEAQLGEEPPGVAFSFRRWCRKDAMRATLNSPAGGALPLPPLSGQSTSARGLRFQKPWDSGITISVADLGQESAARLGTGEGSGGGSMVAWPQTERSVARRPGGRGVGRGFNKDPLSSNTSSSGGGGGGRSPSMICSPGQGRDSPVSWVGVEGGGGAGVTSGGGGGSKVGHNPWMFKGDYSVDQRSVPPGRSTTPKPSVKPAMWGGGGAGEGRLGVPVSNNRRKALRSVTKYGCIGNPRLYRVYRRGMWRVRLSLSSLDSGSAFFLVDEAKIGGTVYVWFGSKSQIFTKNLAQRIAKEISHHEMHEWKDAFWVIHKDGETATGSRDTKARRAEAAFWKLLGREDGTSPDEDSIASQGLDVVQPPNRLYIASLDTTREADTSLKLEWSLVSESTTPFRWEALSPTDDGFLMECPCGELYLWVGEEATMERRGAYRSLALDRMDKIGASLKPTLVMLEPAKGKHMENVVLFHQRFNKFGTEKFEAVSDTVELISVESEVLRMHSPNVGTLNMMARETDMAMSGHAMPLGLIADETARITAWRTVLIPGSGGEGRGGADSSPGDGGDGVKSPVGQRQADAGAEVKKDRPASSVALARDGAKPGGEEFRGKGGGGAAPGRGQAGRGTRLEPVEEGELGLMTTGDAFAVLFEGKNGARRVLYLWAGGGSTAASVMAKAALALRAKEVDSKADQIQLEQGTETPFFLVMHSRLGIPVLLVDGLHTDHTPDIDARGTGPPLHDVRVWAVDESTVLPPAFGKSGAWAAEQQLSYVLGMGLCPWRSYLCLVVKGGGEADRQGMVTLWHGPEPSQAVRRLAEDLADPATSRLLCFLSKAYASQGQVLRFNPPNTMGKEHSGKSEEKNAGTSNGSISAGGHKEREREEGEREREKAFLALLGKARGIQEGSLSPRPCRSPPAGGGKPLGLSGLLEDTSMDQGGGTGGRMERPKPRRQRPVRLFVVSGLARSTGAMFVREIGAGEVFRQCDLCQHESYVLDGGGSEVFVWHGISSKPSNQSLAVDVAVQYVKVLHLRRSATVQVSQVNSGHEPPSFTWCFRQWDMALLPQSKDSTPSSCPSPTLSLTPTLSSNNSTPSPSLSISIGIPTSPPGSETLTSPVSASLACPLSLTQVNGADVGNNGTGAGSDAPPPLLKSSSRLGSIFIPRVLRAASPFADPSPDSTTVQGKGLLVSAPGTSMARGGVGEGIADFRAIYDERGEILHQEMAPRSSPKASSRISALMGRFETKPGSK